MADPRIGLHGALLIAPFLLAVPAAAVSVPALSHAIDASPAATSAALSVWFVAAGTAMPLAGALGRRHGLRPVLALSCWLVLAGVATGVAAPDVTVLLLGRTVAGFGAGAALVLVYAAIGSAPDARARASSLGVVAAAGGIASGLGPLLGGLVPHLTGPRGVLALPALGLVVAPAVLRATPRVADRDAALDVQGAALQTTSVLVFTAGPQLIVMAPGPHSTTIGLACMGAASLLFVLHLRRSIRRPDGYLPVAVVTARGFAPLALCGALIFAGYGALMFAAPRMFGTAAGWNVAWVGLALTPAALSCVVAARWAHRLAERFGTRRVMSASGALVSLSLLGAATGRPWAIATAAAIGLCGYVFTQAAATAYVMSIVPPGLKGVASAQLTFFMLVGAGVGPALLALLSDGASVGAGAAAATAVVPALATGLALGIPRSPTGRI